MSIRLIAIDMDGTLLSSGGRISPRNRAALLAAERAGVEVVIATGRRQAYAMPLIAEVGLSARSVMISSNGAVVRGFDGTLIDCRLLPRETARGLCGELRGYGSLVFTFDRERGSPLVIEDLKQLHARIEHWVAANRHDLSEIRPLERAFAGGDLPIQGMLCGTVAQVRRAESELRTRPLAQEISTHRTEYEARDLGILDLLPARCSKATAIETLAQMRSFGRREIMAIGDNLNDLEMLDYAGRGVLMANAGEEMLAMGERRKWELAATNDEDGVARVIESVLESVPRDGLLAPAAVPVPMPVSIPVPVRGWPGDWSAEHPARDPDGSGGDSGCEPASKHTIAGWTR